MALVARGTARTAAAAGIPENARMAPTTTSARPRIPSASIPMNRAIECFWYRSNDTNVHISQALNGATPSSRSPSRNARSMRSRSASASTTGRADCRTLQHSLSCTTAAAVCLPYEAIRLQNTSGTDARSVRFPGEGAVSGMCASAQVIFSGEAPAST